MTINQPTELKIVGYNWHAFRKKSIHKICMKLSSFLHRIITLNNRLQVKHAVLTDANVLLNFWTTPCAAILGKTFDSVFDQTVRAVLYSNEVLKSFFGISVLYFTAYISVYFYFYFATFCKENGYFYSDIFSLKPSLLVTKSNHL